MHITLYLALIAFAQRYNEMNCLQGNMVQIHELLMVSTRRFD